MRALVDAGMDVARVSLSHGPVEDALTTVAQLRAVARDAGRFVGVLADLPGPKVRAAEFAGDGVLLVDGAAVELVAAGPATASDDRRIGVEHPTLLDELEAGDRVALGDGAIQLVVDAVDASRARARVATGGWVQGRPGVLLPVGRATVTSPTPEDLRLLEVVVDAGVDHVAVSFVRSAADIAAARAVRPGARLVAKIETAEAVAALPEVIDASDAVMVARGDLGLRCPLEDVPHHQKQIIRTSVAFGRPVITATQMLESMVRSPVPTRAEVTDIVHAVFDGTSALMLSAETAIGHHPVAAVTWMARIAERAEREFDHVGWGRNLERLQTLGAADASASVRITAAVSAAAWRAVMEANVDAVIACTNSGATARAIARFRPSVPIIAATPSTSTAHALALSWGVTPMLFGEHGTTDDIVWFAVQEAVDRGLLRAGALVAVLVGSPKEPTLTTDTLRLVRVG